jgi:sialate O-acetylesterase
MVMQRDLPIHLWGTAATGETVTATFRGESRSAAADNLGRWSLFLKPSPAGGPFALTVGASNALTFDDVWVGDVWLASGQSNMEWPLELTDGAAVEIAQARDAQIRWLRVAHRTSSFPLDDLTAGGWRVCTPESAPKMSAVGYYFARHLHERHQTPIGVIDASWGGTPLAAFTPFETIARDAALMPTLLHWSGMARAQAGTLLAAEKERREFEAAAARARAEGREPPPWPWRPEFDAWTPAAIYNAMVAPVTPFPIRGVIWYQGESDASPERAPVYARLFQAMIQGWRRAWGVGDFPFLFVQLAAWTAGPGNAWPELREAQTQALSLVNTGMAIAVDVGHPTDIHPRDKKSVGVRLALAARALAYGESIEYSGPLFRQATPEGASLRVWFEHADGLTTRLGAAVEGFEIAGADGKYVQADARIEGSTVLVAKASVPSPRLVRYGWADYPRVSLYNAAGLPASPFRSAE